MLPFHCNRLVVDSDLDENNEIKEFLSGLKRKRDWNIVCYYIYCNEKSCVPVV